MNQRHNHIAHQLLAGNVAKSAALFSELLESRKRELAESITQTLTEIQWRSTEVVNSALDAEIYCGFEAETVWDGDAAGRIDIETLTADELDEMSFDDVEVQDFIREQRGNSVVDEIYGDYIDALADSAAYNDAYSQTFDGMRSSIIDDDNRLEEFLSDTDAAETYAEDIGEYRQKQIEYLQHQRRRREEQRDTEAELLQDPDRRSDTDHVARQTARVEHITQVIAALDRELARYQSDDIDQQALLREYFRDEHTNGALEFFDWANKVVEREHEDDIREQAWQDAQEEYPIDLWIEHQDRTLSRFLRTYDIYVADSDGYIDQIGEYVYQGWITNQSEFDDYVSGEYNTTGDDPTIWHIETDSSIQGGLGAEIVSPVYDSPREMLDEMFALFDWLVRQGVTTNRSTGLHVTMSMPGSPGQINPVKMAVMLDDVYLLKQFDRLGNSYTQSQLQRLIDSASAAAKGSGDLSGVEQALAPAISTEKMRSINFKDAANNEGNRLIEFRIAGGANYINQVDKVRDAVVRYATTMQLAYDADAYKREYATKLARLLNRATEIGASSDDALLQSLLQAVKELGITSPTSVSELIRELFRKQDTPSHDKAVFLTLRVMASAMASNQTKNKPTTRIARLLRSALQKTNRTPEQIAELVVTDLSYFDKHRVVHALAELLAAPKLLDHFEVSPIKRIIQYDPRSETLLVKGSVLNHMEKDTLDKINPETDIIKTSVNIRHEINRLGNKELRFGRNASKEDVLPKLQKSVNEYLGLLERTLGGPLYHEPLITERGDYWVLTENWTMKTTSIQDNTWYHLGIHTSSQSRVDAKKLFRRLRDMGVYVDDVYN